jgi:hypothetical protein
MEKCNCEECLKCVQCIHYNTPAETDDDPCYWCTNFSNFIENTNSFKSKYKVKTKRRKDNK